MTITRRHFLRSTGAITLGFAGVHRLFEQTANATPHHEAITPGFGPLVNDPDGLFDLPKGFRYTVVAKVGDAMSDGLVVPGFADGMAAFAGPMGRTVLVCNHEIKTDRIDLGPLGTDPARLANLDLTRVYDGRHGKMPCPGGTTTLLFNTETQKLEGQKLSLTGTLKNCAGGPTPWNTWVSCEETVDRANDEYERDHGYNFEVPAQYGAKLADPIPLKAMGRFNHEAIAVDPRSGIVYETEDREDGIIYRYIPNERARLGAGGRLQAMVVRDRASLDTRNWSKSRDVPLNEAMAVEWIDIHNVESPDDDLRFAGFEAGACRFARGEGMWTGAGEIFFACTSGGHERKGQIWRYIPSSVEGTPDEAKSPGLLELYVEPNDGGIIDNADNITVAPWGDLIICEDGDDDQYLVGVTPSGGIYHFAKNAVSESELAGATFSPDGSTLFVNIQKDGLTLAITGPWRGAQIA